MTSASTQEDDFLILDDSETTSGPKERWRILLVDDEPDIHQATRYALDGFTYDNKDLEIVSALSAREAMEILEDDPEPFCLAFIDVVMESDDAGLKLVRHIREERGDRLIRVILRTGQPGMAPERYVIENYDIDDYKAKTELTAQKLITSVISSLRAWKELMRIEKIVIERTAEISEKNKVLHVINKDLTDSIIYARRIQEAILPLDSIINSQVPRFTVFYEPKDIVSGDFYWFYHRDNVIYFAVVDCTGHGVPGAFMAVLGYSLLNQVVNSSKSDEPSDLLTQLDLLLRNALRHNPGRVQANHDGMDLALCVYRPETQVLKYAGARRPLYWYHKEGVTILPGARHSIGGESVFHTETQTVQVNKGDMVYMFTDGITDQFGGEDRKKLLSRRWIETLDVIITYEFKEHEELIRNFFLNWKQDMPQTDDVLVMGMQVV